MAYVYSHTRKDTGEVFYIGVGIKDNEKFKRAHETASRNNQWYDITEVTEYEVNILHKDLSIELALAKEMELIDSYGLMSEGGKLSNIHRGATGLNYKCEDADWDGQPIQCFRWEVSSDLREAAKKKAKQEGRTLSNFINYAVKKYISDSDQITYKV